MSSLVYVASAVYLSVHELAAIRFTLSGQLFRSRSIRVFFPYTYSCVCTCPCTYKERKLEPRESEKLYWRCRFQVALGCLGGKVKMNILKRFAPLLLLLARLPRAAIGAPEERGRRTRINANYICYKRASDFELFQAAVSIRIICIRYLLGFAAAAGAICELY